MNYRDIVIEKRPCPCCNHTINQNLEIPNVFKMTMNICEYCGFVYREKFFNDASWIHFAKYNHKTSPNYDYYIKDKQKASHLLKTTPHFKENEPSKRRLDIGCKMGVSFYSLGFDIGLELSRVHYAYAKETTNSDIRNTYSIEDGAFDVINLYNVLSTIPNPGKYIGSLSDKLTTTGVIVVGEQTINIINGDNMRSGFDRATYSVFTNATLENLFKSQGYVLDSINNNHSTAILTFRKGNPAPILRLFEETKQKALDFKTCVGLYHAPKNSDGPDPIAKIYGKIPACVDGYFAAMGAVHNDEVGSMNHIEEVGKAFPNYSPALVTMGRFYYQHRQFTRALDCLLRGLETIDAPDLLELAALCYYDLGIYDMAAEYFNRAFLLVETRIPECIEKLQSCYDMMNKHG